MQNGEFARDERMSGADPNVPTPTADDRPDPDGEADDPPSGVAGDAGSAGDAEQPPPSAGPAGPAGGSGAGRSGWASPWFAGPPAEGGGRRWTPPGGGLSDSGPAGRSRPSGRPWPADDPVERERRLALLVDHFARIPAEWSVRPVAGPFGAAELRETFRRYGNRRVDVFELRTSDRGVRVLCLAPSASPDGSDPLPLDLNDLLRGLLAELAKTAFEARAGISLRTVFEPPTDLTRAVFYTIGLGHPIR